MKIYKNQINGMPYTAALFNYAYSNEQSWSCCCSLSANVSARY